MPRPLLRLLLPAIAIAALGCGASTRYGSNNGKKDCCLEEGRRIAERFKVDEIKTRRFTHTEFWAALDPMLKPGTLKVSKFGESLQGRALNAITVGSGPTTVLLWSQMH
ncbi:MAG: hypothetical protein ABI120_20045, partial [Gemmatimonadaceae bacterium]